MSMLLLCSLVWLVIVFILLCLQLVIDITSSLLLLQFPKQLLLCFLREDPITIPLFSRFLILIPFFFQVMWSTYYLNHDFLKCVSKFVQDNRTYVSPVLYSGPWVTHLKDMTIFLLMD